MWSLFFSLWGSWSSGDRRSGEKPNIKNHLSGIPAITEIRDFVMGTSKSPGPRFKWARGRNPKIFHMEEDTQSKSYSIRR